MARKRIPSGDRRASILLSARSVFAERGYDGAKTQHIAAAAKVSESLVFRHFPTKRALYRAVLADLVREQDASFESTRLPEANTKSLLQSIWNYLETCVEPSTCIQTEGNRILLASLAGDTGYAYFVFTRAIRRLETPMRRATNAARSSGDINDSVPDPVNASLFISHVGAMMAVSRFSETPPIAYRGTASAVLSDAFRFCARGLGVSDAALRRYEREQRTAKKNPIAPQAKTGRKRRKSRRPT